MQEKSKASKIPKEKAQKRATTPKTKKKTNKMQNTENMLTLIHLLVHPTISPRPTHKYNNNLRTPHIIR